MASVVEVQQSKPRVGAITLKLEKYEAVDLKTFISEWFRVNYGGSNHAKKRDENPIYAALQQALEGKAPESAVKVNNYL